jgi:hypothetical protein
MCAHPVDRHCRQGGYIRLRRTMRGAWRRYSPLLLVLLLSSLAEGHLPRGRRGCIASFGTRHSKAGNESRCKSR